MELEFLGTGAGSPAKFRNVSSVALKLLDEENAVWLFDVGEGTQHQILHTTIRPRKVDKIFITHLHGDHIFGLPGFLSSRSFQGGEKLHPLIFEDNKFKVSFQRLDHRIECVGYRIEEKDHPGELLIDKLRAEHVPSGPIYGRIKAGEVVTLPDGRTLDGKDYIGEPQKGRIITILGDTRQTPGILELAQGADVLVHESTFGKGESKLARNYYHSTCIQAAKIANKAGVKQLLLNHISARYVGPLATQLQKDAASIFSNVKVVKDFDVIDVPFKKKGEKS